MSVLRRLVYREVITAVALVSVAFLGLFFFFDVIDELSSIGQVSPINPQDVYQLWHALLYVLLQYKYQVSTFYTLSKKWTELFYIIFKLL